MAPDSVSAIMPVRDGEQYVAEALDSILGQTAMPTEVIVVDDGSIDNTPAILASYGDAVRVVTQEASGHAAAINAGTATATGTYFSFLDADDLWLPDALACRLDRLHQPDSPEAVFGRIVQFVSPELGPEATPGYRFDPGPSVTTLFQAMVIRRDAFARVGPFDPALPSAANIDWISRARLVGLRIATVENVVVRRRLHRTNMGVTMGERRLKALTHVVRMHHERTHGGTSSQDEAP